MNFIRKRSALAEEAKRIIADIPEGNVPYFLAKISEQKDDYIFIYGPPKCCMLDIKVNIGQNDARVLKGVWLTSGKSGYIEVNHENKLNSISFSPEEGMFNRSPFLEVINIT